MTQMYLVSNDELNTLARRRRLDVLDWVREAAAGTSGEETAGYDQQLIEEVLHRVEQQVRADRIDYDYHEREVSPLMEDEFAALEEDSGEDEGVLDFAYEQGDEDEELVVNAIPEDEQPENVPVFHDEEAEYPAFPSQHTEVAEYTAEDDVEPEPQPEPEPAPVVAPAHVEEEGIKRNAAAQRQLNREISLIDRE